ncbi:DUF2804 domain-containing protein [Parvibaculum sp.]|jgi:hypothetical protein|uniref:DUF2804 domain-containing protein n=1 Tax=Parvibaculum sp. TaxID=2024848 RepID=UPI000C36FDD4|nr:DUF2804 domain-containing protein [Parvibaculum sp.]MAM95015.1 hypothetical protein [Parvibaculum sp.]HCX67328.1 DUF2804 domain-containing protein [Rhodobiaceae bacterium]|tara:strand:- start:13073 stop:14092 length:1020 start_codon:yes stop_codon:yes gene_type:complete
MQRELTKGDLLDEKGRLIEKGWARSEMRRYSRAAIGAPWYRIKEWDYYCMLAGPYGLSCVVADNGYMGLLGVTWLDFEKPKATEESIVTPFPRGRMKLPESADAGDIVQHHPKIGMAFRHEPGGRRLSIDCPDFGKGRGLKAELFLEQPPMDRMVIATPFANAPRAFYYNQKINCMPVSGSVSVGGEKFPFEPSSAFGVLDWGRGVWTYDNVWYWGSASGLADGKPFGFNIGYGFGDTSAATENMIFFEGRAHKFDEVTFHIPPGTFDGAPWSFTSNDGRFEMRFDPIIDRHSAVDLKLIRSIQHQVFGRFSGTAVLDDGRRIEVKELLGFAEEVRNRW